MASFEQAVKVILATFTVFTGFTLTAAIKSAVESSDVIAWIVLVALSALLLRFIIGSAIHLNYTYVEKTGNQTRSKSVALLFKDLIFLVLFGMLAITMTAALTKNGVDLAAFLRGACLYLLAGFLWSPVDHVARKFHVWWTESDFETAHVGSFWRTWMVVDAIQLVVTVLLLVGAFFCRGLDPWIALIAATLYVGFLLYDMYKMIGADAAEAA